MRHNLVDGYSLVDPRIIRNRTSEEALKERLTTNTGHVRTEAVHRPRGDGQQGHQCQPQHYGGFVTLRGMA